MDRAELNRLWRLVGEVDPKGVDLELGMLEQWAQEATEAHGGVPLRHLASGLPWAARRLNWQVHAGSRPAEAPQEEAPLPKRAPWLQAEPSQAEAPGSPEAPALARRGLAQAWRQAGELEAAQRPRVQGLHPEELRPAPRAPEGSTGQVLSLAQRQRAARRRGQESLAQAMAARPEPKGQPPLWADEAGEVLPEWAQVIGMHEHPVATARRLASEGEPQAWRPEPGTQPRGWAPLPGERPHGPTPGPSTWTPGLTQAEAKAQAWAGGATVAELLAQGPEAWPEPDEGPRGQGRPWDGQPQISGWWMAWAGLTPQQRWAWGAAALAVLATLLLVP